MNLSISPTPILSYHEAENWPLDRLVEHIIRHYHVGALARLRSVFSQSFECYKKHQLVLPHLKLVYQKIGDLYLSASVHFYHEENNIFPRICEIQHAKNENKMVTVNEENSIEVQIDMMEGEHFDLEEEYNDIIKM